MGRISRRVVKIHSECWFEAFPLRYGRSDTGFGVSWCAHAAHSDEGRHTSPMEVVDTRRRRNSDESRHAVVVDHEGGMMGWTMVEYGLLDTVGQDHMV